MVVFFVLQEIGDNMTRIFHIWILAYLLVILIGCGFKANPYYDDPSKAASFTDLESVGGMYFVE